MIHRIGAAAVFSISGGLFCFTMSPTVSFWDCGEFVACAATLGIPHPPGSPLYILIGRLLISLYPGVDPAVPMNFLSVLTSAIAVMLVYLISHRLLTLAFLTDREPGLPTGSWVGEIPVVAGAATSALMLAASSTFWFNAIETEVYGISVMLMALVLWVGLVYISILDRGRALRLLLFCSYLIGLAGGLHLLCLLAVPSLLIIVYYRRPEVLKDQRIWLLAPVLFVLGYSTYLSLPIRSALDPVIDQNNPENVANFLMFLRREQYGSESLLLGVLNRKADFLGFQIGSTYLKYLLTQFAVPGLAVTTEIFRKATSTDPDVVRLSLLPYILGLAGAWVHFGRDRRRFWAVLALFLITGLGLAVYLNMPDPQPRERDYVFVGSFVVFAIWIGTAAAWCIRRACNRRAVYGIALAALMALAMPGAMAAANYRAHDRSNNRFAVDYAYNLLSSCEPDAVLFTNGDNDTFPLWYLQQARGYRKDVRVVCLSLLNTGWYIKQLRDQEPQLPVRYDDAFIDGDLTRFDRASISRSGRYWPQDRQVEAAGLTWTLPAGATRILRIQDVMVLKLIEWIDWSRPVYVAITVPVENQLGLDAYLPAEGMVFRLNRNSGGDVIPDRTRWNLLENYRYRGVTDPGVYKNEETRALVTNYYASFLQLADHLILDGREEEAVHLLNRCEAEAVPPEDWEGIALLVGGFHRAGETDSAQRNLQRIRDVEGLPDQVKIGGMAEIQMQLGRHDSAAVLYTEMIDRGLQPALALYNRAVSRERLGNLAGAVADLETLARLTPGDTEVQQALDILRRNLRMMGGRAGGGESDGK